MSADDDNVMPFGWNLDPDQLATERVDDEAILAEIDKLSVAQYSAAGRNLPICSATSGWRSSTASSRRGEGQQRRSRGRGMVAAEIVPWPAAVPDLAPHLTKLAEILAEYVIFSSKEATDAVVLWCASTHLHNLARWSPYLMVWSPEVESGKTSLLKIVIQLVQRAAPVANISPAMIYRVITIGPRH